MPHSRGLLRKSLQYPQLVLPIKGQKQKTNTSSPINTGKNPSVGTKCCIFCVCYSQRFSHELHLKRLLRTSRDISTFFLCFSESRHEQSRWSATDNAEVWKNLRHQQCQPIEREGISKYVHKYVLHVQFVTAPVISNVPRTRAARATTEDVRPRCDWATGAKLCTWFVCLVRANVKDTADANRFVKLVGENARITYEVRNSKPQKKKSDVHKYWVYRCNS